MNTDKEMVDAMKNISQYPFIKSSLRTSKQPVCSILMVDDDYEYILILSRYLASPNIQIEIESDWWEAVNRHTLDNFDLIIADVNMPKYNGRAVFDYVQQYLKGTRMLFITALNEAGIQSFLPERITKLYPIISKSKGISHVRDRIQIEVDAWLEEKAKNDAKPKKKNPISVT